MIPVPSFRAMTAGDLDAVAAAEADVHEFPWSRSQLAGSLAAGHGMWVAELGGGMAAYGVVMMLPEEAELLDIAVLRAWQGRGVGRAMLDFLMARAAAQGARAAFLEVRVSNRAAQALYRGAGFCEVGRRRAYYPARSGREDALVMRKEPA